MHAYKQVRTRISEPGEPLRLAITYASQLTDIGNERSYSLSGGGGPFRIEDDEADKAITWKATPRRVTASELPQARGLLRLVALVTHRGQTCVIARCHGPACDGRGESRMQVGQWLRALHTGGLQCNACGKRAGAMKRNGSLARSIESGRAVAG